jgi:hypothetical protein
MRRIDEFIGVPALDAQHSLVHRMSGAGFYADDSVFFSDQVKAAAAAAEGTYRKCLFHGQIASLIFSISV